MKLMSMFCRLTMTVGITVLPTPTSWGGAMVRKPNRPRPPPLVVVFGAAVLCWLQLLAPAMAGERIPPYAIEASALLHQVKQRVPELRTSKFGQIYETTDKRNTRPDTIPFTAGGMLCRLESKDEYCIAFEIDAEVKQRPVILEQIKKVLTDPCAEIDYPTKTFSDADKGKPDYGYIRSEYLSSVNEVKRIHVFFQCAEPNRRHYEIMINLVRNLDDWMTPRIPRGTETKKKLLENLVEQIIVPVY